MLLTHLRLTRFRQHADTEIDLAPGLTGILGPNGAGKSTVLEAAAFALYGADAIRGTKQGIRWNRAPARQPAEVVLEFEVGGVAYVVRRSESDASLDTPDGPTASGTSTVNAAIPALLGMTLAEFERTFLVRQKDLMRLSSLGATERQAFYRQIMGVGRVDDAVKAAREAKNDMARERGGLAAGLGEREPLATDLADASEALQQAHAARETASAAWRAADEQLKAAQQRLARASEQRDEHERLTREIRAAEREVEEACAQHERLAARLEEAEAARARLAEHEEEVGRLPALRRERDRLVEARAAEREREVAGREVQRVADRIKALRAKLAEERTVEGAYDEAAHEALTERRLACESRLHALEEERAQRRHSARAALSQADGEIAEVKSAIESLEEMSAESGCPVCLRPLGDHLETVLAALRRDIEDAEARHRRAEEDVKVLGGATEDEGRLQREIEQLREEGRPHVVAASEASQARCAIEMIEASLAELEREHESAATRWTATARTSSATFDPANLALIERTIATLEALDASLAADRALAGQEDSLARDRALWSEKAEVADQRVASATSARLHLAFDADEYARLSTAASEVQRARDAAAVAHARADEAESAAENRKARSSRALEEYDRRAGALADLTERLRVADVAAARLADFRASVASGIRPELEEITSGLVAELTDGRFEAVTITEDFECVLYRQGVPLPVISGGEEDAAAFALRIATSQMIAERSGRPQSVLILDEPFGAQDVLRRENMMGMIRRLGGLYPQVLLISHVEEVKHVCDHAVVLDYDEAAGCCRVQAEFAGAKT